MKNTGKLKIRKITLTYYVCQINLKHSVYKDKLLRSRMLCDVKNNERCLYNLIWKLLVVQYKEQHPTGGFLDDIVL